METKIEIKKFLGRFLKHYNLRDDEDIFSLGFVNSLFAMQLVQFVEKRFSITIENDDLNIDNFRSLNALERLVTSKTVSASIS